METDSLWDINWPNTPPDTTSIQSCPGETSIGKTQFHYCQCRMNVNYCVKVVILKQSEVKRVHETFHKIVLTAKTLHYQLITSYISR